MKQLKISKFKQKEIVVNVCACAKWESMSARRENY